MVFLPLPAVGLLTYEHVTVHEELKNSTFRNIIIYIYIYNHLSSVLLKHEEMEYILNLHLYNIFSYCLYFYIFIYYYNLRQFTIDSLLAARQMFFACP
jgi:hypothetical protein